MTIVVEIASRTGTRAYKEYDAPSVDAAIKEANRELQAYPEFWVTGFSVDRGRAVQRIPKEENLTAGSGATGRGRSAGARQMGPAQGSVARRVGHTASTAAVTLPVCSRCCP
jgi:hypothetical protein